MTPDCAFISGHQLLLSCYWDKCIWISRAPIRHPFNSTLHADWLSIHFFWGKSFSSSPTIIKCEASEGSLEDEKHRASQLLACNVWSCDSQKVISIERAKGTAALSVSRKSCPGSWSPRQLQTRSISQSSFLGTLLCVKRKAPLLFTVGCIMWKEAHSSHIAYIDLESSLWGDRDTWDLSVYGWWL